MTLRYVTNTLLTGYSPKDNYITIAYILSSVQDRPLVVMAMRFFYRNVRAYGFILFLLLANEVLIWFKQLSLTSRYCDGLFYEVFVWYAWPNTNVIVLGSPMKFESLVLN